MFRSFVSVGYQIQQISEENVRIDVQLFFYRSYVVFKYFPHVIVVNARQYYKSKFHWYCIKFVNI